MSRSPFWLLSILALGCAGEGVVPDGGDGHHDPSGTGPTASTPAPEVLAFSVGQDGFQLVLQAQLSAPVTTLGVTLPDGSVDEVGGTVDASGWWEGSVDLPDPCTELGEPVSVAVAVVDGVGWSDVTWVEASITLDGVVVEPVEGDVLEVSTVPLVACGGATGLQVHLETPAEILLGLLDGGGLYLHTSATTAIGGGNDIGVDLGAGTFDLDVDPASDPYRLTAIVVD